MPIDPAKSYWIKHAASTDRYLTVKGSAVVLSSLNAIDSAQQWKFQESDSKYLIVNNTRALSVGSYWEPKDVKLSTPTDSEKFSVNVQSTGPNQQLIVSIEFISRGTPAIFLQPGTSDRVITSRDKGSEQWTLIPVNHGGSTIDKPQLPLLHQGIYHIRSFDTKLLLTMDSETGAVYVTRQGGPKSDRLKEQMWTMTRNATNGLYNIYNNQGKRYLDVTNVDTESDVISKPEKSEQWSIETVVQGVLFSIKLNGRSIGFRDNSADDLDRLALKRPQNIPSQLWFFEKAEDAHNDKFNAKRYQKVPEDKYVIRSCHHAAYLRSRGDSGKTQPVALELTKYLDKPVKAFPFVLKYKDDKSPIFTLQHESSGHFLASLGNGDVDLRLYSDESAIEWMLVQQVIGKSDPPFSIVLAADRFQALSCRTGENDLFTLDVMQPGESMQMWNLRKADVALRGIGA